MERSGLRPDTPVRTSQFPHTKGRQHMKKTNLKTKKRGQGMTEYIIIVALIAIAAIGIITLFGDNIRRLFGMSADALAGETDVSQANTTSGSTNAALTKK